MGRKRAVTNAVVEEAIRSFIKANGMPPTVAELRDAIGVGSTRTIVRYLRDLEDLRVLRRWPGARGMVILPKSKRR